MLQKCRVGGGGGRPWWAVVGRGGGAWAISVNA